MLGERGSQTNQLSELVADKASTTEEKNKVVVVPLLLMFLLLLLLLLLKTCMGEFRKSDWYAL